MSGLVRFLTAGESHGEALVAVIDGIPAGLPCSGTAVSTAGSLGPSARSRPSRDTTRTPLRSVDLATKEAVEAVVERSDVCALPADGIVGEAMMAIVLAGAFLEKFGGDRLEEIRRNYDTYLASLKNLVALLRR